MTCAADTCGPCASEAEPDPSLVISTVVETHAADEAEGALESQTVVPQTEISAPHHGLIKSHACSSRLSSDSGASRGMRLSLIHI